MNDLSFVTTTPTTALSKTSAHHGEASSWVAPLVALALNLIVPAAIIDADAWGFAEIVLFVAAFGALIAALVCSVLGQHPPWQAEHQPRGSTTILVEFSFYLIGLLMICLVVWRLRALAEPMAGCLPA
jgi:fumarate reductase subunit D